MIRFNEQGLDGLTNIPSPGVPGKLDEEHRAFLTNVVEEGPMMRLVAGFPLHGHH